jgi:hypothetical protein
LKVDVAIFVACLAGCIIGSILHFWILVRLERAGADVKYFGTVFDVPKTHRLYLRLARDRGWSVWPMYLVHVATVGIFGLVLFLFLDRPLVDSVVGWVFR